MPRLLLLLILFGSFSGVTGQQIIVRSTQDSLPLNGVVLFNDSKTKSLVTDEEGRANITDFGAREQINFQYYSHLSRRLSKERILEMGREVWLEEESSTLDEIVLSVSRFGQKKKEVPQQIVTLNEEEIRFRQPQTSADLLENTGRVFVQKSQSGGGSPMIRGFSTNRLLIAVDGTRFNTAIFRGGNVQNVLSIDPFTIERTEVILGPGSVLYGSDAVGGVMNFFTKRPAFSFEEGMSFAGNASARYASANNEKTGHLDLNFGMKEWAFITSVSYSDFGDVNMGSNGPDDYLRESYVTTVDGVDTVVQNSDPERQLPTAYNQLNLMQKVRFMPSANWDFNLGLIYTTTGEYDRYDRLIQKKDNEFRFAEWYYGPQQWFSAKVDISHQQDGVALFDDSKLGLSYQQSQESRNNRRFGSSDLFINEEQVDVFTANLDLTKSLGSTNLYYGLEYVFNGVSSDGSRTDVGTGQTSNAASRYPDGSTWQSMAAYASLQSRLAEGLSFQGGLRYSHIFIDASFEENNAFYDFPFADADLDNGALTGSAGITWNPNESIQWKVNFGTAFRAPNIDDIGKVFDSEPGSVVVPNPEVKPEYAYNGEVGVLLNFGGAVSLDVSGYYTWLMDALVRRDYSLDGVDKIDYQGELSQVQAIQNAGKARVYGFEAGVEVNFDEHWQFLSQYNLVRGTTEEGDGIEFPIRHVAPPFGNTHLRYTRNRFTLDAFAEYNGRFDFEDLAPSQRNNDHLYAKDENGNPFSPSWYTVNIGAEYALSGDLTVNALLENITDQRYRPYSSGIAAPGTNLVLSASYTF
jgi:hemoglobin/transferrin/lactoferrin receptor protein